MAVRIIIERKIKKGKELDLAKLLLELRSRAVKQKETERMEVQSKIDDLLTEPSKTKIYELVGAKID